MAHDVIDSAHIVRILAQEGHTHRCARCDTRMLVKGDSNLCVHCYNDLRAREGGDPEGVGRAESARDTRAQT